MLAGYTFNLHFYFYGILLLIGYVTGLVMLRSNFKSCGVKGPGLVDLSLVILISGIVGARINYILLFPKDYTTLRDCLAVHEGGLVFYGAFIGIFAGLFVFCRVKKISLANLLDFLAPSFAAAHSIGRWGCISNGCCYGKITDWPAIYSLASDMPGVYRHPTQLYESFFLLFLACVLMINLDNVVKKGRTGMNACLYVLSYSIFRFFNEFLRGDDRGAIGGLTALSPAQITSLIAAACSILFIIYVMLSKNKNGEPHNESHQKPDR